MNWKRIILIPLILMFGFQGHDLFAAQTGDSMTIAFTGHLMGRRACTVNNNQVINVAFGTVAVNKVAIGEVIKNVDYTLNCAGASESNSVEMTLSAVSLGGHPASMASSQAGLWITFLNEGAEQNLNAPFVIADWRNPPKLEFKLEKDPALELQAAAFTATATLKAEYF